MCTTKSSMQQNSLGGGFFSLQVFYNKEVFIDTFSITNYSCLYITNHLAVMLKNDHF